MCMPKTSECVKSLLCEFSFGVSICRNKSPQPDLGSGLFLRLFSEANTVLSCFEKLKSRFKVIGKSTITLYISFVLR